MIIILNTRLKKHEKWVDDDFQKEKKMEKERQRKIRRKQSLKKFNMTCMVFGASILTQAMEPGTLIMGAGLGLQQGFKYNGNWKRGVIAGAITVGVMGTINGVINTAKFIKDGYKLK